MNEELKRLRDECIDGSVKVSRHKLDELIAQLDQAQASAPVTDERAAFESWYHAEHGSSDYRCRSTGVYCSWDVQVGWQTWQARAALCTAAPAAVPQGWKLVPVEVTEDMLIAARDWAVKKYGLGIGDDGAIGCYGAMLAAPTPPAAPSGEADAKDAERLDFIIGRQAFIHATATDAGTFAYQLMEQDEDEEYHILSGADAFWPTHRAAIDAAIAAQAKERT